MNDLLKQRILRALDGLDDERGYQMLDYIEFLESKYAERARPGGIFARLTETVEDTMRAGKLPIQAISGTMGLVDGAAKVMKGLAAAGQAVVDEAVKAAEGAADAGASASRADTGSDGERTSVPLPLTLNAEAIWPPPSGRHPATTSPSTAVRPRHRPPRRHLPGGRLHDRLGHLHRLGRHQPPGLALGPRRAAAGLGDHRAHDGGRARSRMPSWRP